MELSKRVKNITPSLTLRITALSNELKAQGKDVIGFGAGEPDFGTPDFIKDAAKEALNLGLTKYTPASGTKELRRAVCERQKRLYGLNYEPEQVVCSNGAKHSLFNACMAILNPGDEVLLPAPYWLTYPELITMADAVPVAVMGDEARGFKVTAAQLEAKCTDKTKAVILNTPSNPCGSVYTRAELHDIAALAVEKGLYVISDEIYDMLVYGDAVFTSIAMINKKIKEQTIVVAGMSKTYAMTGWRMGFTLSELPVAKAMGSYQSHAASNPCSITQYASVSALNGPQDFTETMRRAFDRRRKLMCSLIDGIPGLSAHKPEGAFYVMLNIEQVIGKSYAGQKITGSLDFTEILLKETLTAVVPGISFGTDKHVRLSYATSDIKITEGLRRIAEFCSRLD